MNKFRKLRADEIDVRIGQTSREGSPNQWYSLLLYKDARCDMAILDETVTPEKWQRDHKELKGNIYCGVSILCETGWVTKWDAGAESNTEKEKGEASDSFKRACVNWGIGRELYTSPTMFIGENYKSIKRSLYVKAIDYVGDVISYVIIGDHRDKTFEKVFRNAI